jgi:transposase
MCIVATIDGAGLKRETREFRTTTSSLKELKECLEQAEVAHVVMESTLKPVYHILELSGMTVWIMNIRHVKHVPGHKTDKHDSKWLCKLLLARVFSYLLFLLSKSNHSHLSYDKCFLLFCLFSLIF